MVTNLNFNLNLFVSNLNFTCLLFIDLKICKIFLNVENNTYLSPTYKSY